jgi:hypothetical protein
MKQIIIKTIRFPIAIICSIGAFILGWCTYFFAPGIGLIHLAYLIFWCLPVKLGIFKGATNDQEEALQFQIKPFMLCVVTFKQAMNGFIKLI